MSCYIYIFYITYWLICEHVIIFFYYYSISVASAANVSAQVNSIPMLNQTIFKIWKKAIEIVLGCMDLELALRMERPTSTPKASNEVKIEK